MKQIQESDLLDFLAEGFLQQGASVTYTNFSGTPALRINAENTLPQLYILPEEEISKIAFLKQVHSEEIFMPVLRTEDELKLKAALAVAGVTGVKVYRLSLQQRYAWYSRKLMCKV